MGGPSTGGTTGMFRNKIINGDMRINQREVAVNTANTSFPVDRWCPTGSISVATGTLYAYPINDPASLSPSAQPRQQGFKNSIVFSAQTAVTVSTTGFILPMQRIEAHDMMDFGWCGSGFGSEITLSFWFRAKVAANYSAAIVNTRASAQSYNTTFAYNNEDVWQYVTIVIPPPPGTGAKWDADDNGLGMEVVIGAYEGRADRTTAIKGWSTLGNYYYMVSGSHNWPGTINNYIELTGVQLEKGTLATPFERRPYGMELQMCQRYYQVRVASWVVGSSDNTKVKGLIELQTIMRSPPTLNKTEGSIRMGDGAAGVTSSATPSKDDEFVNQNKHGVYFDLSGFTGIITHRPYRHEPNSGNQSVFTLNAEI
jgi:hypothetical protein